MDEQQQQRETVRFLVTATHGYGDHLNAESLRRHAEGRLNQHLDPEHIDWSVKLLQKVGDLESDENGKPVALNLDEAGIVPVSSRFESRFGGSGDLENISRIHIDARRSVHHHAGEKIRLARCGDCGIRYAITSDPTENHHRAQEHRRVCGKGDSSREQRANLLNEFHAQENIVAQRERWEAGESGIKVHQLPPAKDCQRCGHTHRLKCWCGCEDASTPEQLQLAAVASAVEKHIDCARDSLDAILNPRQWWQFWRWLR